MGQVATVTIGADNFSVYGLTSDAIADATTYFAGRLGSSAWTAATADDQKKGLISAARLMDRALKYSGEETVSGQALGWPRDGASCDSTAVPDGTVPDDVALCEFELALALLGDASIQDSSGQGSNVKRVQAGSASVEFFVPTVDTGLDIRLPQAAWDLIKCYLAGSGGLTGALSFGVDPTKVDEQSHFDSCTDSFNLTEGYP